MTRWLSALLLAAVAVATAPAAPPAPAVEPPLVTDRPTRTASAVTVPAGRLQNELGYTHTRVDGATLDALGEWSVRWGVVRDLEVDVWLGSVAWLEEPGTGRADGWTDSRVGLKWTSQHGAGPSPTAALILGSSLPTGGDAFREDTLQPDAAIAMSWDLGDRVAVSSNLGWGWASRDLARFHRWWGSLMVATALGRGLGAFVEGYGFLSEEPDGPATGYLDGGLTWGPSPTLQLDLRAGLGRNGRDEEWFLGAGVAWRTRGP